MTDSYWLFKTEPEVFSWEMLKARGKKGEPWDGVRNFQARNNMKRDADRRPRLLLPFGRGSRRSSASSRCARSRIPTRRTTPASGSAWTCVRWRTLPKPVTLAAAKANPKLASMALAQNSRLSVQPVSAAEWNEVCRMGGLITKKLKG